MPLRLLAPDCPGDLLGLAYLASRYLSRRSIAAEIQEALASWPVSPELEE